MTLMTDDLEEAMTSAREQVAWAGRGLAGDARPHALVVRDATGEVATEYGDPDCQEEDLPELTQEDSEHV